MESLPIEPTYRVVLGDVNLFRLMVVGVGGTGSTLALFLAGLAFHARQKGIQVDLTLVDHDVVAVAVAAIGVIREQDRGVLLAEDRGESLGGLGDRGPHEAHLPRRVRVQRRPEPGVGIPQARHRATPSASALLWASASRRAPRVVGSPKVAAASPAAPSVARTRTTRCPSAAARAIVPAVRRASSSGWAWKATSVCGIRTILAHDRLSA